MRGMVANVNNTIAKAIDAGREEEAIAVDYGKLLVGRSAELPPATEETSEAFSLSMKP